MDTRWCIAKCVDCLDSLKIGIVTLWRRNDLDLASCNILAEFRLDLGTNLANISLVLVRSRHFEEITKKLHHLLFSRIVKAFKTCRISTHSYFQIELCSRTDNFSAILKMLIPLAQIADKY